MISEAIKARFEHKAIPPLRKVDLKYGEKAEVELKKKSIFGHAKPLGLFGRAVVSRY